MWEGGVRLRSGQLLKQAGVTTSVFLPLVDDLSGFGFENLK